MQRVSYEYDNKKICGCLQNEMIWLSIPEMAKLFNKNYNTVRKYVNMEELIYGSNMTKIRTLEIIKGEYALRTITYYNLEIIIKVGKKCKYEDISQFRTWARKTIRKGEAKKKETLSSFFINPI